MRENEQQMTIGYLSPTNPFKDRKGWSGTYFSTRQAIEDAGFDANLVSNADDVGIIHKRIIQNLYDNPIVICDVSGKNPNVMFELGMRLAFDKPAVIVMDNQTQYSFDTSVIEHITYPRNLDYYAIIDFQNTLSKKICATIESSNAPDYSTFLKQFAKIKIAKIEDKEGTAEDLILSKIDELDRLIALVPGENVGMLDTIMRFVRRSSAKKYIEIADLNRLVESLQSNDLYIAAAKLKQL